MVSLATLVAGTSGLVFLLLTARRIPKGVPAGAWPLLALTGLLDVTANALFLLAARIGLVSLVAVISSLYPASTVLLARVVLHERVGRRQQAGLALAAVGVVLIAS